MWWGRTETTTKPRAQVLKVQDVRVVLRNSGFISASWVANTALIWASIFKGKQMLQFDLTFWINSGFPWEWNAVAAPTNMYAFSWVTDAVL